MRWFKQLAHNKDWIELVATTNSDNQHHHGLNNTTSADLPASKAQLQQQKFHYSILADGNLLIIRSLQQADNRAKFRCLANNTYGMNHADTEIRLELYPQSKLVEVEPKVEYINNNSDFQRQSATTTTQQQQQHEQPNRSATSTQARASFNCTIRASNLPLVAIEWLKDGKLLASISLPRYSQLAGGGESAPTTFSSFMPKSPITFQPSNGSSSSIVSMFDDINQELTLIEQFSLNDDESAASSHLSLDDSFLGAEDIVSNRAHMLRADGIENIKPTSLAKLEQLEEASVEPGERGLMAHRLSQRVRFAPGKDRTTSLLYQLRFSQLRRSDRGSYQCRARTTRGTMHATGQLLLKDNPPLFVETFPNQLINTESIQSPQASLKCIASGSPLPEISWRLSGFQIPESSRYRVGDYVTRDGLIVSFVNITNVQAEGECFLLSFFLYSYRENI